MKLIIGLGNPGADYAHTRHNIGWDAVGALATDLGASFVKKPDFSARGGSASGGKAEVADLNLDGRRVMLVHPLTFMNLSGEAVQKIMSYYKVEPSDLLVVHDERDFALGELAFTPKGGDAGHKGVSSIQQRLATDEIARLRLGIGRPAPPIKMEDFVLQRFTKEEQATVDKTLERSVGAMKSWLADGLAKAMNEWNRRV